MHLSYIDKISIKVTLMTIMALFGVFYFFYSDGTIVEFIVIRIIAYFFCAANAIGSHRWLCHYSFKPTMFGKYFMLTGLVVTGYGKPLHLAIAHGIHHTYTDKELDPHSPKYHSFLTLWLGRYTMHDQYVIPTKFFREKEAMFVNNHYWKLFWILNIIISVIDLKTALILSPINFVYSWTNNTIVNYYGHKQNDTIGPNNLNAILTFLTLGEGLHKTHHANPSSYDFSSKDRIDPGKKFIEFFLIKKT
jgi:stearoyl-CoA desaturase (delta-9 desaturase)